MYRIILGSIIGLLGGIVGGMFGMSGAFIIIPLLLITGVCSNQLSAQGTTLCMLLPPISIFAAYSYYKKRHVDMKLALLLIVFYIFGTLIGSKAAISFSEKKSRINFAILLLLLSGYVFYTAVKMEDKPIKL